MAFRNTSFTCPGCRVALAAETPVAWCSGCKGVWVSEAELEERVRVVRGMDEFNLAMVFGPGYASGAQAIRPCPSCRQPLRHATLGDIEVDRCDQKHGIWFDAGELESVLTASTAGVAVTVPPVEYGPEEHRAIEQVRTQTQTQATSFDESNIIEPVAWVVGAILGLLS